MEFQQNFVRPLVCSVLLCIQLVCWLNGFLQELVLVLWAQRLRAKQNRLRLIRLNLGRRLGREQQDYFLRRLNEHKQDIQLQPQGLFSATPSPRLWPTV